MNIKFYYWSKDGFLLFIKNESSLNTYIIFLKYSFNKINKKDKSLCKTL